MTPQKKVHQPYKQNLHPRNKHRERYNFEVLKKTYPNLSSFTFVNEFGDESIDFFNPLAVKALNSALLKHYYHLDYWDIPHSYLCPPIPGRADYIHYMADLIYDLSPETFSMSNRKDIRCLDIGVGANCIYPIIGVHEYGWSFVATDIDPISIQSAQKIIDNNPSLKSKIDLRIQKDKDYIFRQIIYKNEHFDLTICNPPFHASAADAQSATKRKLHNLTRNKSKQNILNFGGQSNELWYKGGELAFIKKMIQESKDFSQSCNWFSTLVSKETNLKYIHQFLNKIDVKRIKTIPMSQGNKSSRIVAWSFMIENAKQ